MRILIFILLLASLYFSGLAAMVLMLCHPVAALGIFVFCLLGVIFA